MGEERRAHPSPRLALIRALSRAIVRAMRSGDTHAAQVAYEALGRLMDEAVPEAKPAALTPRAGRA